jgi:polyphosphate kinase
VEIDLIVRGMCALRPGIRGVSDHIRVRSIVGRFLEHSRIFYFANGGQDSIYLSSADWMPRNLYERVEVMFPVKDPLLCDRIRHEILDAYLADTLKARVLRPDGSYVRAWQASGRRKPPVTGFSAQDFLLAVAEGKQTPSVPALPEPKPSRARARKASRTS